MKAKPMNTLKRLLASVLIVSTATMGVPLAAQAAIVSTADAVADTATLGHRATVDAFLARADVQQGLQAQGLGVVGDIERVHGGIFAEGALVRELWFYGSRGLCARPGWQQAGGGVPGVYAPGLLIFS